MGDIFATYWMPWLILVLLASVLSWATLKNRQLGLRIIALIFLVWGIAHLYLAFIDPREYLIFGQYTIRPYYRRFIYMILFRQAIWMGALLGLFHFVMAWGLWFPVGWQKWALLAAGGWLLLVAPLGWAAAFPATILLAVACWYHFLKD